MIAGFLRELKRRRVLNTASLYVVGAWIALQVVDLLSEAGLPPSATRNLLILLSVGFVPVLVVGWFFDVSVKGITRTRAANPGEVLPKLEFIDHLLLAGLLVVVLGDIYTLSFPIPDVEPKAPAITVRDTTPSIAVLPFTFCVEDEVEEALAMGVSDQVLRRLVKLAEIRVAAPKKLLNVTARSSSFLFGESSMDPENVAEALGVNYLLSASVCREKNLLTVSAELLDKDAFLTWSGDFKEDVNESGEVRITLAESIANAVAGKLSPARINSAPEPVDRIAYENLLIGREFGLQGQTARAREALQRALERKPDYPEAVYELALLELPELGGNFIEGMQKAKAEAEYALAMARRELELDPDSANTHYIVGRILAAITTWDRDLAWRLGKEPDQERWDEQFTEAEEHFRRAIAIEPTLADAYYRLGKILETREAGIEALKLFELALVQTRDPFNPDLNVAIALQLAARGQSREALDLLDRFRALPVVPPEIWQWQLHLMMIHFYYEEQCELIIDLLINRPQAFDAPPVRFQAWWFILSLKWLHMDEEAAAWMAHLEDMPGLDQLMRDIVIFNYQDMTGGLEERLNNRLRELATVSDETLLGRWNESAERAAIDLAMAGEIDRAISLMEAIRRAPSFLPERQADASLFLVKFYQHVGRFEDARPILEEVVTYLEAEVADGIRHPQTLDNLAQAYALQGQDDKAIEAFRMAVDFHGYNDIFFWAWPFPLQAAYVRLKDDPRMVEQLARIQANLSEQRRNIEAMLAPHDLDVLLAPLMTMNVVPESISHGHDKE